MKTMANSESSFSQIRKIDNTRKLISGRGVLLIIFLIALTIWFIKGGSFKLYASLFFTIYFLTQQIWLSVISIGILQNIIFLPLRIIGNHLDQPLKDFEEEIDKTKEEQQVLVLNKKVKEGNFPVLFYIFNFFVNTIAFISAGRVFLIDLYSDPLKLKKMNLLYDWVPYPQYPLKGINFHVPLFRVTQSYALEWSQIFTIIGFVVLFFVTLRLLWRILRIFLKNNKKILYARIKYNHLLLMISGFGGVALIFILFFLRHIPTSIEFFIFIANLSRQNTSMNFFTAFGTFFVTVHAGYKVNSQVAQDAQISNVPPELIQKVFKEKMRDTFRNAFIIGLGAFFLTNKIPSAFELSVITFEIMYMIYPYTFGLLIKKTNSSNKQDFVATQTI